jgi:hypothetical protein
MNDGNGDGAQTALHSLVPLEDFKAILGFGRFKPLLPYYGHLHH